MKTGAKIGIISFTSLLLIGAAYLIFIHKPKKDAKEEEEGGSGNDVILGGDPDIKKGSGTSKKRNAMAILKAGEGTVSVKTVLNVRSQPSTSSYIVTRLKNGTKVDILSYANGWFGIKYFPSQVKTYYVSSDYIK